MKRVKCAALFLIVCLLGGCSGMSIDELYCLPQASEDYYDLQEALSGVLEDGLSYAAPASGAKREPVQLVDLDHDGTDEAVAFFRSSQDGTVAAYIFARNGSTYELAETIPCSGSAVGSVEYADLDGSGSLELLITCQVSEAVTQALQVSRYQKNVAESLLTAPCGRYILTDLNGDGAKEILCITDSGAEAAASVTYYTYSSGQMKEGQALRLSENYGDILDITQGTLEDGTAAVVVTGTNDDRLRTDVLIQTEQTDLTAVDCGSLNASVQLQGGTLYPTDMDGDGNLEIPQGKELPEYEAGSGVQWIVEWYGLTAKGKTDLKCATYHCFDEGWYLELPESWDDAIAVREKSETNGACTVHSIGFYRKSSGRKLGEEIMTVYALYGAARQEQVETRGLTSLYSDTDRILAVEINENAAPWEGTVSVAQLSERFHVEAAENHQ